MHPVQTRDGGELCLPPREVEGVLSSRWMPGLGTMDRMPGARWVAAWLRLGEGGSGLVEALAATSESNSAPTLGPSFWSG